MGNLFKKPYFDVNNCSNDTILSQLTKTNQRHGGSSKPYILKETLHKNPSEFKFLQKLTLVFTNSEKTIDQVLDQA